MSNFLGAIDPAIDPNGAAAALQEVLDEPPPQFTVAPTFVTLPGGWAPRAGELCRDAEVRELTGIDEEALDSVMASSTVGLDAPTWIRYRRTLVERGLVAIGEYKAARSEQMTRQLFLGDRDAILLGIRIATYGPDYEATINCTGCNDQKSIIFELDKDIEYKTCADPYGYVSVSLRGGSTVVLRRPVVEDQDYAFGEPKATMAEVNSKLLSRVLISVDDINLIVYPGGALAYVRQLGIQDREMLSKAVIDREYGPKLGEVRVDCPDCGTKWTGALSLPSLFRV